MTVVAHTSSGDLNHIQFIQITCHAVKILNNLFFLYIFFNFYKLCYLLQKIGGSKEFATFFCLISI